jgi:hypothetical protein
VATLSTSSAAAWANLPRLDPKRVEMLFSGLAEADRFFNGEADMQRATWKVAQILEENGIPYAITDGMALNAYGFLRVTNDVDLLLTREGLESFQALHPALTEHGVPIDVVLTGEYPGDGKPSPWSFRTRPRWPYGASEWRCCRSPA